MEKNLWESEYLLILHDSIALSMWVSKIGLDLKVLASFSYIFSDFECE